MLTYKIFPRFKSNVAEFSSDPFLVQGENYEQAAETAEKYIKKHVAPIQCEKICFRIDLMVPDHYLGILCVGGNQWKEYTY